MSTLPLATMATDPLMSLSSCTNQSLNMVSGGYTVPSHQRGSPRQLSPRTSLRPQAGSGTDGINSHGSQASSRSGAAAWTPTQHDLQGHHRPPWSFEEVLSRRRRSQSLPRARAILKPGGRFGAESVPAYAPGCWAPSH